MSEGARPFKVLGVQQIAVGADDRQRLRALWVDALGLTPSKHFQSVTENVDEEVLQLGSGPARVEVDLMQPLDTTKKPRVDVPALNHIGLWIDNLQAAHDWLRDAGVRIAPGGIRKGASGQDVFFIHPRPSQGSPVCGEGVLIELVQAPDHVIAHYR
jgi:lactoylglutathione lyase